MRVYKVIVDGFEVGVEEFTNEEVVILNQDSGIQLVAID
jgi:hypothetical protein